MKNAVHTDRCGVSITTVPILGLLFDLDVVEFRLFLYFKRKAKHKLTKGKILHNNNNNKLSLTFTK